MGSMIAAAVIMYGLYKLHPTIQLGILAAVFFLLVLPVCILLWRAEGFAFWFYAMNTVFGSIWNLLSLPFKLAFGV